MAVGKAGTGRCSHGGALEQASSRGASGEGDR